MVVVVGIIGIGFVVDKQHSESVTDGDAGSHDEEMVGKAGVVVVLALVDVVIEYQHCHHHCLACACGHLEGGAGKHIVAVVRHAVLSGIELIEDVSADIGVAVGHLVEIDGRFDRLTLTEE